MNYPDPNIELSQPSKTYKPTSKPQNYNYLPQNDDESFQDLQTPSATSETPHQSPSILSSCNIEKANKIAVLLLLILYCSDILPLLSIPFLQTLQIHYVQQLKDHILRPFGFMSANLKADPILDIQVLDHGSTCPSGFKPLKLANWPGTLAGCLCENGDLLNSPCSQIDSPKCKTDVPNTYPIEIFGWDNSIFCAKRAVLGIDYLKKLECPGGYRECYPGGCFRGDCPITNLEISYIGEKAYKFNEKEKYVAVKKTRGELPLVDIQLTLGDIPCFNDDFFTKNITSSAYELAAVKEKGCDKYGRNDQFSKEFDSNIAYNSFIENAFSYSTFHLPHFEENANLTVSVLSSMVRMKTAKNENCLEINEKLTKDFIDTFPIELNVLSAMFLLIAQCCGPCFRVAFPKDGFSEKETNEKMLKYFLLSQFLSFVHLLMELRWYILHYLPFQAMKNDIAGYDSLGCFAGSQGQAVISDYLEILRKIDACCPIHFVIVVLNILPILVWIWYYSAKKRLSAQ